MRVAVVDLGSNSTRLLVADVRDQKITEIYRRSTVTRLAEGVDGSGALSAEGMARVFATLKLYRLAIDKYGAETATAVMTSAVRDAVNGEEFRARVAGDYRLHARILSGDEEARLTYAGAVSERPAQDDKIHAVIDIGGGSTEFVIGAGHDMRFHTSTQVGVVRHSERHLHHDPPTAEELDSLTADVQNVFESSIPAADRGSVDDAIAVAGTATSCAAIVQRIEPYDPSRVEGYRLTLDEVETLVARLAVMHEDERRALPGLHPDRAPTIVAGAILLASAMRAFALSSVQVSEHDLLRGAALASCDQSRLANN